MILYHGTNIAFETIDLLKSKPNKDFGQGFYLTTDKNQAIEMILLLIQRHGMDEDTALRTLYNSDTFAKLEDPKTHLYYQSSLYVYDFLKNEPLTGKMQ